MIDNAAASSSEMSDVVSAGPDVENIRAHFTAVCSSNVAKDSLSC